jgi:beta-phosphoglucomutase
MSPEEVYILEGQGVEEVASQLTRKFNLPPQETPKIIEKKKQYFGEIEKLEIYPYLLETLEWARQRNLKIGLVTGGDYERVERTLQNFGIEIYFDVIITSEDVYLTKPSPEPYLRAAAILDVAPEECVVIENAPLGIRSAKAANMKCIAVTTTLSQMFLKEADVITDNLSKVLEALRKLY